MAVIMAGAVTWGLKLTGVSVTAEDTEVADALETYGLLQGASPEEGTQETESTEVSQEETQQDQETSQIEDTQETTEVSTEQTEDTKEEEDPSFELDADAVDGITVTVSGDRSSLPYPADELEVRAEEVTDEDVVSLCDQLMEENEVQADKQYLLSLSLYHGEDEVEPTGNVTVTFSGLDTENYEPSVYSIDTETEDAEDMDAEADEDGDVAVETETFASNYAVSLYSEDTKIGTAISGVIDTDQFSKGGNFYLSADVTANDQVIIGAETTIDLNGHGIFYTRKDGNCFWVQNGAKFTIKDSITPKVETPIISKDSSLYGNIGNVEYDSEQKPIKLTYFVTESQVKVNDSTQTQETLRKYEVTNSGFITAKQMAASIVYVENGTLNLMGGLLTINDSNNEKSHVIINKGTLNISGGYVCGGKGTTEGGGILSEGGIVTLSNDGVIAVNYGKSGGGLYVKNGTFNMSGGVISCNGTKGNDDVVSGSVTKAYERGLGGGIYAFKSNVNISGGYITNNKENFYSGQGGYCNHGGGGIATLLGKLSMSGGYVTGNYSDEAGGGMFLGHFDYDDTNTKGTLFEMTGGVVASNVAQHAEGGGIRISGINKKDYKDGIGTIASISANLSKIYITNNATNSDYDWGGGGVFVQTNAYLNINKVLITENSAGGFGGGVGACPTGKTMLTHENGAAIYGNTAEGTTMSKGGQKGEKNSDSEVAKPRFDNDKNKNYQDYFCVKSQNEGDKTERDTYISLVTGMMLGNNAAGWKGHCDDNNNLEIKKNGYAAAKNLFGLTAHPDSNAIEQARTTATVFITKNSSVTHGGGIMTNGGLVIGDTKEVNSVPDFDISGQKALYWNGEKQKSGLDYNFIVKDEQGNELSVVQANKETGKFNIIPKISDSNNKISEGVYKYYLSECNDGRSGITYDESVYIIEVEVKLQNITILGVSFNSYYINSVKVEKKNGETIQNYTDFVEEKHSDGSYSLILNGETFTNIKHSYELPATGGTGTIKFTIGGLLIVAGSLWYGYSMKRRRERRAG